MAKTSAFQADDVGSIPACRTSLQGYGVMANISASKSDDEGSTPSAPASSDRMSIFVFGSNLAGRHGKGAALYALQVCGAIYGQGVGLQGNSYAIPTKNERIQTLPLDEIRKYVQEFKEFAIKNPELTFRVTRVGCGLAGYDDVDISPMFNGSPSNVILPEQWE